jgi:hypothetical protein
MLSLARAQRLLLLLAIHHHRYFTTNSFLIINRCVIHRPSLASFHSPALYLSTQEANQQNNDNNDDDTTTTMSTAAKTQSYGTISKSLMDDIVNTSSEEPTAERVNDLLLALINMKQVITIDILESTKLGKVLVKTVKTCKRYKRTANDEGTKTQWDDAISTAEKLLTSYKNAADVEAKASKQKLAKDNATAASKPGLPTSTLVYKTRLVSQKKELYKDPPVLPPNSITVESTYVKSLPKRNKTTGELTFAPGNNNSNNNDELSKLLKNEFHPNRTPEEVLRAGSFGGTYFRPITSAVTNISYKSSEVLKDTVDPSWISGLNKSSMLTSMKYSTTVNKYKVKCGGSLGMWESSGWISNSDPYGWFQWYCRFYSGRRCSDDVRQIKRWCKSAGLKGRFRSQICNKILAAGTVCDDVRISPVIRQTLLHWGLEITDDVLNKHRNRK